MENILATWIMRKGDKIFTRTSIKLHSTLEVIMEEQFDAIVIVFWHTGIDPVLAEEFKR